MSSFTATGFTTTNKKDEFAEETPLGATLALAEENDRGDDSREDSQAASAVESVSVKGLERDDRDRRAAYLAVIRDLAVKANISVAEALVRFIRDEVKAPKSTTSAEADSAAGASGAGAGEDEEDEDAGKPAKEVCRAIADLSAEISVAEAAKLLLAHLRSIGIHWSKLYQTALELTEASERIAATREGVMAAEAALRTTLEMAATAKPAKGAHGAKNSAGGKQPKGGPVNAAKAAMLAKKEKETASAAASTGGDVDEARLRLAAAEKALHQAECDHHLVTMKLSVLLNMVGVTAQSVVVPAGFVEATGVRELYKLLQCLDYASGTERFGRVGGLFSPEVIARHLKAERPDSDRNVRDRMTQAAREAVEKVIHGDGGRVSDEEAARLKAERRVCYYNFRSSINKNDAWNDAVRAFSYLLWLEQVFERINKTEDAPSVELTRNAVMCLKAVSRLARSLAKKIGARGRDHGIVKMLERAVMTVQEKLIERFATEGGVEELINRIVGVEELLSGSIYDENKTGSFRATEAQRGLIDWMMDMEAFGLGLCEGKTGSGKSEAAAAILSAFGLTSAYVASTPAMQMWVGARAKALGSVVVMIRKGQLGGLKEYVTLDFDSKQFSGLDYNYRASLASRLLSLRNHVKNGAPIVYICDPSGYESAAPFLAPLLDLLLVDELDDAPKLTRTLIEHPVKKTGILSATLAPEAVEGMRDGIASNLAKRLQKYNAIIRSVPKGKSVPDALLEHMVRPHFVPSEWDAVKAARATRDIGVRFRKMVDAVYTRFTADSAALSAGFGAFENAKLDVALTAEDVEAADQEVERATGVYTAAQETRTKTALEALVAELKAVDYIPIHFEVTRIGATQAGATMKVDESSAAPMSVMMVARDGKIVTAFNMLTSIDQLPEMIEYVKTEPKVKRTFTPACVFMLGRYFVSICQRYQSGSGSQLSPENHFRLSGGAADGANGTAPFMSAGMIGHAECYLYQVKLLEYIRDCSDKRLQIALFDALRLFRPVAVELGEGEVLTCETLFTKQAAHLAIGSESRSLIVVKDDKEMMSPTGTICAAIRQTLFADDSLQPSGSTVEFTDRITTSAIHATLDKRQKRYETLDKLLIKLNKEIATVSKKRDAAYQYWEQLKKSKGTGVTKEDKAAAEEKYNEYVAEYAEINARHATVFTEYTKLNLECEILTTLMCPGTPEHADRYEYTDERSDECKIRAPGTVSREALERVERAYGTDTLASTLVLCLNAMGFAVHTNESSSAQMVQQMSLQDQRTYGTVGATNKIRGENMQFLNRAWMLKALTDCPAFSAEAIDQFLGRLGRRGVKQAAPIMFIEDVSCLFRYFAWLMPKVYTPAIHNHDDMTTYRRRLDELRALPTSHMTTSAIRVIEEFINVPCDAEGVPIRFASDSETCRREAEAAVNGIQQWNETDVSYWNEEGVAIPGEGAMRLCLKHTVRGLYTVPVPEIAHITHSDVADEENEDEVTTKDVQARVAGISVVKICASASASDAPRVVREVDTTGLVLTGRSLERHHEQCAKREAEEAAAARREEEAKRIAEEAAQRERYIAAQRVQQEAAQREVEAARREAFRVTRAQRAATDAEFEASIAGLTEIEQNAARRARSAM